MRGLKVLLVSAALAAAGCNSTSSVVPPPTPSSGSPIKHIIVMVQENRSFDNIFAGFPGADTAMEGPCKPSPWCKGSHVVPLHSVKLESSGSPALGVDIDHSHHGFEIECDKNASGVCRNDGFGSIRFGESGQSGQAKLYPYAYVDRAESKPYWDLAKQYALADEMFFTETASSFIAHQMLVSGTVQINKGEWLTDQPNGFPWGCDAPPGTHTPVIFSNGKYSPNGPFPCYKYATMADLLDTAGVSWLYYVDAAVPPNVYGDFSGAVWNGYRTIHKIFYGPDWKSRISQPNTNIFKDLSGGTLPSVSWVIPSLYDSDHPASGCNGGPLWVTKVVNAIGTSQYWKDTAIVLLWDDWGGWYDNAPPTQINPSTLGFRVPAIVISPYAKPGFISNTHYDFGSILKLMEETFNLGSLDVTDKSAASMEDVFDFTQSPNKFVAAPLPKAMPCAGQITNPRQVQQLIQHDGGVPE